MTVNPYITQEYEPLPAPIPSAPRAAKSNVGGGRKTNRVAMAGAILGILVGLWMAGIKNLSGHSDYEFGQAMADVLIRAQLGAAAGLLFWLVYCELFYSRPVLATFVLCGTVAIGGTFAVRRGLLSMGSIPWLRNGFAMPDSVPLLKKRRCFARF